MSAFKRAEGIQNLGSALTEILRQKDHDAYNLKEVTIMRTKRISTENSKTMGMGNRWGGSTRYEYECPCGQGRIIEEHDDVPGFRNHQVWMECDCCSELFDFDLSGGVSSWELVEKHKK